MCQDELVLVIYLSASSIEILTRLTIRDRLKEAPGERDFEKLYAMGAHPFILWTLMLPVLEKQFPNFRALVDHYNSKIRPYGRPDFGT